MIERLQRITGAFAAITMITGIVGVAVRHTEPAIVVGKVHRLVDSGPPEQPVPARLAPDALLGPSGYGPGGALAFRGAVNVPGDLKFLLIVGSDARPGQEMTRTRADSIHIAAIDPRIRKGTVLGLPRDSYVNVPGYGMNKINSALALGGPDLLARTIRELTGFPISYYAVTGFDGIVRMVDELHGVDIDVPYRMNDRYSGANFEAGWHHMDGNQVLAFSRDRHSLPNGDFDRSKNQGIAIVDALAKLRHETSNEAGIRHWLGVLFRYARLDISMADAVRLGVFARQIVPADLHNVVTPGDARNVGGQSVVVLGEPAFALFRDIGADALADGKMQREAPPATPKPKPKATPTPAPNPVATPVPTVVPSPPIGLPGS